MSRYNHTKYKAFQPVHLPDRSWPDKVIDKAPTWCSVDLRDGNQALIEPMSVAQKKKMFALLVDVGFKEIEVGFPAASQPDFDFVRWLIEEDKIPDDVTIQVLTQARTELIERSFEALKGVKKAIVHLYNSTSVVQREKVFKLDKAGIVDIAVKGAKDVLRNAQAAPETDWFFQYSPESFTGTELDFAVEICDAVTEIWQPTPERKVILNLPATVEVATPNVYADQIEWFCKHIGKRDSVIISLHTHNDRGCGVAASELGLMAGAERVEGTLLGNGERTGNLDVVVMGMNMYSQGVDPELDFSDMDRICTVVKECTQIEVHPRQPYAGSLVFTAFSGSHQDAIKKGFEAQGARNDELWRVPYLPIDPADLGRSYEAVIRVNSQSGKGGFAWVLEQDQGMKLPKKLQADFSRHVQLMADKLGRELNAADIWTCFKQAYYVKVDKRHFRLVDFEENKGSDGTRLFAGTIEVDGKARSVSGRGKGLISSVAATLKESFGVELEVLDYSEHALGAGTDAQAAAYAQCALPDGEVVWGVGIDEDVATASVRAILSAANAAAARPATSA